MEFQFKNDNPLEKRKEESSKVMAKHANKIPCIVEVYKKNRKDLVLDKNKFLVPTDLQVGQFLFVLRKRMKLAPEKALFLFVSKGTMPAMNSLMGAVYDEYKDVDGYLYFYVALEATFG